MSDSQTRILQILQTLTNTKAPLSISAEQSLFDAGILDSFALPELVAALEREFGIAIPDRDLSAQTFESVSRIATYVRTRL